MSKAAKSSSAAPASTEPLAEIAKLENQVELAGANEASLETTRGAVESLLAIMKKAASISVPVASSAAATKASQQQRQAHASIVALRRIFSRYLSSMLGGSAGEAESSTDSAHLSKKPRMDNAHQRQAASSSSSSSSRSLVHSFLHEQYLEFVRAALANVSHSNPAIQVASLNALMELVRAEGEKLNAEEERKATLSKQTTLGRSKSSFPNLLFNRVVVALATCKNLNEHLLAAFVTGYLQKFDDVRFFLYKNLAQLMEAEMSPKLKPANSVLAANSIALAVFVQNVFLLISPINMARTSEDLNGFLCGEPVAGTRQEMQDSRQGIRNKLLKTAISTANIKGGLLVKPSKRPHDDGSGESLNAPQSNGRKSASRNSKSKHGKGGGGDDDNDDDDLDFDFSAGDSNQPMDIVDSSSEDAEMANSLVHPLKSIVAHRQVFSDCWLAFLRLPLSIDTYKRVLIMLDAQILPFLNKPKMLIDFLTDSYNMGGVVSVLALSSLFTLISQHNLDYPDFYKKLYALFDQQIFHVKYRARFFHLANLFLSSSHLPSYLVAAFVKRIGRLALTAPVPCQQVILQMIYNLLLRHPSCMVLIHRELERKLGEIADTAPAFREDPYLADEPNPANSKALESSLWELDALKQHFFPSLSRLIAVFEQKFKQIEYDLGEILEDSYASLFETEIGKKIFKEVPLSLEKVDSLLSGASELSSYWTVV